MPIYTFESKTTGERRTETMTIAQRDQFVIDNPDLFQVMMPLGVRDNFVASRHTNIPIDGDFKNILDNIKRANPGSTVDY